VAFCEIEEYPRKVLEKHWPGVPVYEDVRNVTKERLDADGIGRIDVITGGFPCQDLSVAGNQAGIEASRSGLWGELCRIIGDIRPRYAIVENVTALISGGNGRWFGKVLGDLVEIGYDCEWHCISASELGAHHHRDRVWIICYPQHVRRDASEIRESDQERDGSDPQGEESTGEFKGSSDSSNVAYCDNSRMEVTRQHKANESSCGCGENNCRRSRTDDGRKFKSEKDGILADTISQRQSRQGESIKPLFAKAIKDWKTINAESGCISGIWETESELGRVANGIPRRVDRLKGLGNAVVPQIPELLGKAIMKYEVER